MKKVALVLFTILVAGGLMAANPNVISRVRKHLGWTPETFIWVSDVQYTRCHPGNIAGEKAVVDAIMRHKPSFILNGGDFVENKPPHDDVCKAAGWDNPDSSGPEDFKLFEGVELFEEVQVGWFPIISSVGKDNLYGVPGNHDFFGDTWAFAHKDWYLVRNGVFFLMLNVTGPGESTTPTWNTRWVEYILASKEAQDADLRVVVSHQPGTTNRNGGWNNSAMAQAIREKLYPLFSKYGVDMVLNGHIHTYRRWYEGGRLHIISGGGGGGFQGDAGDIVNAINYNNFIEFTKLFDAVTGTWKLNAKVIGIDLGNPDQPAEYLVDSFELESSSSR